MMTHLCFDDPEVYQIVEAEKERIENTIDLIAAENHAPLSILEAQGSVFNLKAAEGYPGRRFHAGCGRADDLENLAVERGKKLALLRVRRRPSAGRLYRSNKSRER